MSDETIIIIVSVSLVLAFFIIGVVRYFYLRRRRGAAPSAWDMETTIRQTLPHELELSLHHDSRALQASRGSWASTLVGSMDQLYKNISAKGLTSQPPVPVNIITDSKPNFSPDNSTSNIMSDDIGPVRTNLLILHIPSSEETLQVNIRRNAALSELMSIIHLRLCHHGLFELHRLATPVPGASQIVTDEQLRGFLEIFRHAEEGSHLYLISKDNQSPPRPPLASMHRDVGYISGCSD